MRNSTILVVSWIGLTVVSYIIGLAIVRPTTNQQFAERAVPVWGRVVAKEPDNHRIIRYVYVVGGQSYNGFGNGGDGNPQFNDVTIGQELVVFYDAENPEISYLGNPANRVRTDRVAVIFFTVVMPLFIVGPLSVLLWIVRKRR